MTNMMDSLSSLQDGMVAGRVFWNSGRAVAPAQDADAASQITDGRVEFKHVSFHMMASMKFSMIFRLSLNQVSNGCASGAYRFW